ncbi:hypothetical protein YC2023_103774 [Brassica napus]
MDDVILRLSKTPTITSSSFLLQKTNLHSDLKVGETIDIVCEMILEKIEVLIDGFS